MAHIACGFRVLCVSLLIITIASVQVNAEKVFNVQNYGASGDGIKDNADAFIKAWNDACASKDRSRVYIPDGRFYLRGVKFEGPCKSAITFEIKGTLLSPKDVNFVKEEAWILFRKVDWLSVTGGGTLDGEGAHTWPSNDCHKTRNCRVFPENMGFQFVKHSTMSNIRSLNSKGGHFKLFSVKDFNVTSVTVTAPEDSPNTDGIKISNSTQVHISNSNVGTGDDCVAIISGSDDIEVSSLNCGPGHGVSVGSIGKRKDEKNVNRVTVRDSVFKGTSDGVRIKSWESPESTVIVSNFVYENLQMINVKNPINIDQKYCPHGTCKGMKADKYVQIRDVKFHNIWGTTTGKEAIQLQCNAEFPCKDIKLSDINLVNKHSDDPVISIVENVQGSIEGTVIPPVKFL